jgi:predicted dehydrogenase
MARSKGVIIGCGAIAREHLAATAELKNAEIVAVCDLSPARAESTAERFGIAKWYVDHEQMLSETQPDLVHITTPPASHFPLAKYSLAKGLNVLCEKPITLDYLQFEQLKQLAVDNHCMLIENHNFRFHSSVQKIRNQIESGALGDVVDVQICIALSIAGPGNPYTDRNAPHFGTTLRGGVVGDFLTHISYLAYLFCGPILDVRTIWKKTIETLPLPADEFRGFLKGERATAYVSFSGNAQPNGFWLRVAGTRMHAEANLFEPPRLTLRRARGGMPPLMTLIDGVAESRDVFRTSFGGLSRKLGGGTAYDGLPAMIARIYDSLEMKAPQPIPLEEIDHISRLVDRFTSPEVAL